MTFDPKLQIYHYPCPCGDRFEIAIADLRDGEEVAVCPSCSLMIKVIFEVVSCLLWCCDWIRGSRGKANYRDTYRTVYQKKRLRVNHRRWQLRFDGRETDDQYQGVGSRAGTSSHQNSSFAGSLVLCRSRVPPCSRMLCMPHTSLHMSHSCCHTCWLSTRLAAEERHWGCCGVRGIGSRRLHLG